MLKICLWVSRIQKTSVQTAYYQADDNANIGLVQRAAAIFDAPPPYTESNNNRRKDE